MAPRTDFRLFCRLTNQQRREGAFHGRAREDDDGDDVADQAEEGDGGQEDARGHELEQMELQTEEEEEEKHLGEEKSQCHFNKVALSCGSHELSLWKGILVL